MRRAPAPLRNCVHHVDTGLDSPAAWQAGYRLRKMPKARLWTIVHSTDDKCLYIKSGEDVRRDYGALLGIRASKEKEDAVKVSG